MRPRVDVLSDTLVRCLFGTKAWIFAPAMTDIDWADFVRGGPSWHPAGKGRMIILENNPVLIMCRGVRTVYTVFELTPSLMEGGKEHVGRMVHIRSAR